MGNAENLFQKVDALKAEHAKLEGQMESHLAQLKSLGYNNLAEAEKGLADLRDRYTQLDREINERTAELENLVKQYEAVV
jgi:chromosome segregation ATPase